jgi:hypothetical protein
MQKLVVPKINKIYLFIYKTTTLRIIMKLCMNHLKYLKYLQKKGDIFQNNLIFNNKTNYKNMLLNKTIMLFAQLSNFNLICRDYVTSLSAQKGRKISCNYPIRANILRFNEVLTDLFNPPHTDVSRKW